MKKLLTLGLCIITCSSAILAQQQITLDEIWQGNFRTEYLDALQSMNNGKEYTVLNFNRVSGASSIDKFDYKTQKED